MKRLIVTIISFSFFLFGCTTINNHYTYVEEDISVDQWIKSSEAKKGYIFVSGMMTPVMAANIIKKMIELNNHSDIERIRLIINTNGGEANAYRSMMNIIGTLSKPVDTINIGSCYSAGVALFASASGKRYAFPNTHFMVHKGVADPENDGIEDLEKFEDAFYEDIIKKKSKLPGDWFPFSDKMIFFTSEDAKKYEMVEEIITKLP